MTRDTERTIHDLRSTASTQTAARKLIQDGDARIGDIVMAESQTAGRGRFGRTWISPRGGIYATIICPGGDPLLAAKSGLSVIEVLRSANVPAAIKWPNDVLVGDKKLAGVLIESDGECALVGIGMNVAASPLRTSARLADYADSDHPDAWVEAIADALLEKIHSPFDLDAYRQSCVTLGLNVRIEALPGGVLIEGEAVDIDEAGRLVVASNTGKTVISSGDCLHVRSVSPNA